MVWIYLGNKNGREGGVKLKIKRKKELAAEPYRKCGGDALSSLLSTTYECGNF